MNIEKHLNHVARSLPPSGIRRFFDLASEMENVISLGVGEPDFVTPWHIREAGIYALEKGRTYYTSNAGLPELRREVRNYLERRFSLDYHPDDVLITVGGSEAIDLCIRACVNPGEEVLIPEPSFVCYSPCTALAGGIPVPIITEEKDNFILTPEALKAAITDKTKLLVLPFPNNPTGAVMTLAQLEAIAKVLRGTDIIVLSDEIYAELTYGGTHTSIASLDGMRERTVLISGFSKAYAMTGWRLGYACGDRSVIKLMTKIHQFGIMSAPTSSQYAACDALKCGDGDIEHMKNEYNMRRRVIVDSFRKMGLDCFEPRGAFYAFPSVKKTGMKSLEFAEQLLKKEHIAVVPGDAFGKSGEGFIRCSYAYSIDSIMTAMHGIERFLDSYGCVC